MKLGDKITYGYMHQLNSKSSVWREKEAIFLEKLLDNGALIFVIGNKGISKVCIHDLTLKERNFSKSEAVEKAIRVIERFPRRDNVTYDGRIIAVDCIIKMELEKEFEGANETNF